MDAIERLPRPEHAAHWPPAAADLLFLLTGTIAGAAAAFAAYERSFSLPLALYVFAMGMYVVGAGPLHVLGMPHTFQRVVFVLLLPFVSSLLFWGVDARWNDRWIALAVAIVLGGVVHRAIARMLLPGLVLDEAIRAKRPRRTQPLGS